MTDPPLLSLRHATVTRDGKPILEGLEFDLWEGEHVAILGPNGAGKSTLLKLIDMENRALYREDPSVKVFGTDLWDVWELRRLIGVVTPSHMRIFEEAEIDGLTCVLSGFFSATDLYPHMEVTAAMRTSAEEALALMGATAFAKRPLTTLSTGEARRVQIARALALGPRAILLDEPTAGLDLAAAGHFLQNMRKVAATGITVILVTHHVEEILPEVGRVILLKEGKLFFDGPKEAALEPSRLSALYDADVHVREVDGRYFATLA